MAAAEAIYPGSYPTPGVQPGPGAAEQHAVVIPFPGQAVVEPYRRFSWTEFVDWEGQGTPEVLAVPASVVDLVDDEKATVNLPNVVVATSRKPGHNPRVRRAAQSLYTSVYIAKDYVQVDELDQRGLYADEYDERSIYFLAENGLKTTTIRQIRATKRDGILSLPTAKNFVLDADAIAEVAGVEQLTDLKPREMVEISALASDKKEDGVAGGFDATISIYSTMLRAAVEQGHKLWLQNTTPEVVTQLKFLIGDEQVRQIGDSEMYMGSVTTPIAINPQSVVRLLLGSSNPKFDFHKAYLREAFKGLDARKAPEDIRKLLTANDIEHVEPSLTYQIVRSPKAIATAGLAAYALARAMPLSNLEEFTGEAAIFLGIDVATIYPYVWGLEKMYSKDSSVRMKLLGAAVAVGSLISPYGYMYAEGKNYPLYVNLLVSALIGGAITKSVIDHTRTVRREAAIRTALTMPKSQPQLPAISQ